MATTIQGTGGAATLLGEDASTAFCAKLDTWSATLDTGIVETTGFGDKGYRHRAATIGRMSGSASGMVISEFPPIPVLALGETFLPEKCKGELVLTAMTNHTYTFDALITNVAITRPEEDKVTVSFDFQSSGPVTQSAWS